VDTEGGGGERHSHFDRYILRPDLAEFPENEDALEDVAQFPHVAGPGVAL
jgi:hypothetical protein